MGVTITMPQLGETVTEGTILEWVKQVGETVAEDEILVEISTDKVDTEVPSPSAGVLTEILVAAGETVAVGTAIAVLDSGEAAAADAPAESPAEATESGTAPPQAPPSAPDTARRSVLSPVVRKLAAEYGIDIAMVPGTGDGGRVTRKDIEAFAASSAATTAATPEPAPEPTPVPAAPPKPVAPPAAPVTSRAGDADVRDIPRLRRRIAENMRAARDTAAHVWTSVEVDFERVERVRAANRDRFKADEGFSLTYLPFIARATLDALSEYPDVNSQFDLEAGTWTYPRSVNLGIAVDLNQGGLVVANVRGADSLTLKGLARQIRSLADAARSGKAGPDDLAGFTFSITNPGPYGSFMSAPIIPVPNAAILSTETIVKKPVVVEAVDGTDAVAIHHVGYLGLSWDHRVFDGSTAVLFLNRIKENLQTWDWEQELS